MNFKEKIENSPVVYFLGALLAGFLGGVGMYEAILRIAKLETVQQGACIPQEEVARDYVRRTKSRDTDSAGDNRAVEAISHTLRSLHQTAYTGPGKDYYWPTGGLRTTYYHLRSLVSIEDIEGWFGGSIYSSGPHKGGRLDLNNRSSFGHYNPEFLTWAFARLRDALDDRGLVISTKPLIHQFLKHLVWTYHQTYWHTRNRPEWFSRELKEYKAYMANPKAYAGVRGGDDYFYKFAWDSEGDLGELLADDKGGLDPNIVGPAVAFWMRRDIDGTSDEIIEILAYLVEVYDISDAQPPSAGLEGHW